MSEVASPERIAAPATPKVGFVSLGCPKALTDSELILTQLSAEGYQTSKTFEGADLVIVNTCGFIDDAVKESLDTIGEALADNGRVIVTGCLGAKAGDERRQPGAPDASQRAGRHRPARHAGGDGRGACQPAQAARSLHRPGAAGLRHRGLKLTPRHYAYLKISEGCNHRCTFCIIPSMRGDLVSRPVGDVLKEAKALFEGGVKELLVISQDTSAYGVDVKYRTGFWDGKPVKTRMLELVRTLGEIAEPYGAWVRLHYVYPYPSVDEVIPLMASGRVLPYLDVPFQHSHPDVLRAHEAAGQRREEPGAHRALARGVPGTGDPQHLHRRLSRRDRRGVRAPARLHPRSGDRPCRLLCLQPGRRARPPTTSRACCRRRSARRGVRASWKWPRRCRSRSCARRIGATMQVLVDSAPALGRKGGVGRSYADAPEIDGTVRLLPPEKISKTLEGRRVHARAHRRRPGARPGRAARSDAAIDRQEKSHRRPVA